MSNECENEERYENDNNILKKKPEIGYTRSRTSWVPWARVQYKEYMAGLHQEIEDFVRWVSPTAEEKKMRKDVVSRISTVVRDLWPEAKVEVIGSYKTDLCVPTSDVDLVIFGASKDATDDQPLLQLASALEEKHLALYKAKVITTAKVPIIKLREKRSHCSVDIAFEVNTGVENSKIVQAFLNQYPLLRPLTLVIKFYLKLCILNDTWSGGIGSYTLVILIISYLQKHTKLHGQSTNDTENLGHLLMGFFEFYGRTFDYMQVISVKEGGCYYDKKSRKWFNEKSPNLLSVEDPHNPDVDVGSASFKISEAKDAFLYAYERLSEAIKHHHHSYLSQVIYVSYDVHETRDRIKHVYGDDSKLSVPGYKKNTNKNPKNGRYQKYTKRNYNNYSSRNYFSEELVSTNEIKPEPSPRPSRKIDLDEFPSLIPEPPRSPIRSVTPVTPDLTNSKTVNSSFSERDEISPNSTDNFGIPPLLRKNSGGQKIFPRQSWSDGNQIWNSKIVRNNGKEEGPHQQTTKKRHKPTTGGFSNNQN